MKEIDTIVEAMLEKKAKNVCSLDLRKIGTAICDHFDICNANSTTGVGAIADNIEERMLEKRKRKVMRMQGKENAVWVIIEYGNILVHIFLTQYKNFYRLQALCADAIKKKYENE